MYDPVYGARNHPDWLQGKALGMILFALGPHKLLQRGFPAVADSKESACSEGDLGLILRWERSPGEGKTTQLLVAQRLASACNVGDMG